MTKFGTIVLVPFPFTDLSSTKVRPALVVSSGTAKGDDLILSFISSRTDTVSLHALPLKPDATNGLRADSFVRFDKLATLEKRLILGELGRVPPAFLKKHKKLFESVFGF